MKKKQRKSINLGEDMRYDHTKFKDQYERFVDHYNETLNKVSSLAGFYSIHQAYQSRIKDLNSIVDKTLSGVDNNGLRRDVDSSHHIHFNEDFLQMTRKYYDGKRNCIVGKDDKSCQWWDFRP